jgi:hypothetical protein
MAKWPPPHPIRRLSSAAERALKNCANSLYMCGAKAVCCVNKINNLAPKKTGCESCRPSQHFLLVSFHRDSSGRESHQLTVLLVAFHREPRGWDLRWKRHGARRSGLPTFADARQIGEQIDS